jgi:DNA-binding response OmpR family regulator
MTVSYKDIAQSRQQEQPANRSHIRWNAEQHTIVIRGMLVTLTPTEYRLLSPLQHGKPVTYADLARQAYNCTLDIKMRKMMDKHIDRIRGKLQGTGTYVYCILSYGYVLLDEIFPEEEV